MKASRMITSPRLRRDQAAEELRENAQKNRSAAETSESFTSDYYNYFPDGYR